MKKLTESRILRIALIGITVLAGLQLIAMGIGWWITGKLLAVPNGATAKIQALERIATLFIGISAMGAIGTVLTAVIARYGLREATGNLARTQIPITDTGQKNEEQ